MKLIDKVLPFVLVVVCAVSARLVESELAAFSMFIATVTIYAWRRYDARIMVGVAVLLLAACAVMFMSGAESHANKVTVWAYNFVVIGVFGLLITDQRERKENEKKFGAWFSQRA